MGGNLMTAWHGFLLLPADGGLDHAGDDAGGEDNGKAGEGVNHGGLAALHVMGIPARGHVEEGAPHEEERCHRDADAEADDEEVGEEAVNGMHCAYRLQIDWWELM